VPGCREMELGAGSRMPVVLGAVGRADCTGVGMDLPSAAFSDGVVGRI